MRIAYFVEESLFHMVLWSSPQLYYSVQYLIRGYVDTITDNTGERCICLCCSKLKAYVLLLTKFRKCYSLSVPVFAFLEMLYVWFQTLMHYSPPTFVYF